MDANANGRRATTLAVRAAAVLAAALSLMLVAALAAPSTAEAHQQAGRTQITVDGETVKNTRDDHFTVRRTLTRGCHNVEVISKREGRIVASRDYRICTNGSSVLVIEVDHTSVSFRTVQRDTARDTDGTSLGTNGEPAAA